MFCQPLRASFFVRFHGYNQPLEIGFAPMSNVTIPKGLDGYIDYMSYLLLVQAG